MASGGSVEAKRRGVDGDVDGGVEETWRVSGRNVAASVEETRMGKWRKEVSEKGRGHRGVEEPCRDS